ncbi:hypothetical protein D0C36_07010 [Mucilaginibacter conchicola]|uniref:Uncharacterized protein n=1 Tax=Mucilaginibacter conchicola TaxID=2303333 RepID=A0A372NZE4_9SPHI|nr:hypothetical protein [Mucilaginibacter conchicola]RFZ95271.1 hypothetical protein D0C36_07010 [Mucilaginibacter conchicola]
MKTISICLVLVISCFVAFGQKAKKTRKAPRTIVLNWEPVAYPDLQKNIDQLRYDSVKVFSFGCEKLLNPQPKGFLYKTRQDGEGIRFGEPIVDSTQHWLPTLADAGHVLSSKDTEKILTTVKKYLHDQYKGNPLGCFDPHMGIVFFKNGIANAHMDVCLGCSKMYFEIFNEQKVMYRFNLELLGKNTENLFRSLKSGYQLIDCK